MLIIISYTRSGIIIYNCYTKCRDIKNLGKRQLIIYIYIMYTHIWKLYVHYNFNKKL